MAKMIPDQLPESIESGAERRCYDALRTELSDAFTILYNVAWVGRGRYEGQQGQCDFLVLHPEHGALVLEVKGGTPRRPTPSRPRCAPRATSPCWARP